MNACCFDCRFFDPYGVLNADDITPAEGDSGTCEGECHRNPPVVGGWIKRGDGGFRDYGQFPKVFGADWCGAFEPARRSEQALETCRSYPLLAILKDDPDQDLPGEELP